MDRVCPAILERWLGGTRYHEDESDRLFRSRGRDEIEDLRDWMGKVVLPVGQRAVLG